MRRLFRLRHVVCTGARQLHQSPTATELQPRLTDQVQQALAAGRGVVALESTVITHGLPYPQNYNIAIEVEEVVRSEGAEPATVAVIDGVLHVGLQREQLKHLATHADTVKISRRDYAFSLAEGLTGGTTVSGTMLAAAAAGIGVFATGGVGGVHRGVEQSWDISADLTELGRTPVAVVSAGVKSILDVPKTLEVLETQGVPVVVYGPDNRFPGFFTRDSGSRAPYSSESLSLIAQMIAQQHALGQGLLVACPVPVDTSAAEQSAFDRLINDCIQQALAECSEQHVTGQRITPFLLARLNELTGGQSLQSNLRLLRNNALVAARLANIMAAEHPRRTPPATPAANSCTSSQSSSLPDKSQQADVVVFGASIVDFIVNASEAVSRADGTTYNGHTQQHCGGVARNHADALTRLGVPVRLVSAVGDDANARYLRSYCGHMDMSAVATCKGGRTANYAAVLYNGDMQYGVGDIDDIAARITPDMVKLNEESIARSRLVVMDGNMTVDTIETIADICHHAHVPLWFEPTDRRKLCKIFRAKAFNKLFALSPNRGELIELYNDVQRTCAVFEHFLHSQPAITPELTGLLSRSDFLLWMMAQIELLVITLGARGVLVCRQQGMSGLHVAHVAAPDVAPADIVSVSGAGDCFNAGLMAGWLQTTTGVDAEWEHSVVQARRCAHLSLLSSHPVPAALDAARC